MIQAWPGPYPLANAQIETISGHQKFSRGFSGEFSRFKAITEVARRVSEEKWQEKVEALKDLAPRWDEPVRRRLTAVVIPHNLNRLVVVEILKKHWRPSSTP